jgi:hypothetical protein
MYLSYKLKLKGNEKGTFVSKFINVIIRGSPPVPGPFDLTHF